MKQKRSFTYIELLITLTIIAVLFLPIMRLFSHSLYSTSVSKDLITAVNLAKWQMERLKNLNLSKEQLKARGDEIYPSLEEPPFEINEGKWRIQREVSENTDPLEVRIKVFRDTQRQKSLITLVTLFEDMTWEEIRPIK